MRHRPWDVYCIDLADDKLRGLESDPRFHFVEGDITINREWVEYHVKKCDVVVPRGAIERGSVPGRAGLLAVQGMVVG